MQLLIYVISRLMWSKFNGPIYYKFLNKNHWLLLSLIIGITFGRAPSDHNKRHNRVPWSGDRGASSRYKSRIFGPIKPARGPAKYLQY